jgi:hypothetical protein
MKAVGVEKKNKRKRDRKWYAKPVMENMWWWSSMWH